MRTQIPSVQSGHNPSEGSDTCVYSRVKHPSSEPHSTGAPKARRWTDSYSLTRIMQCPTASTYNRPQAIAMMNAHPTTAAAHCKYFGIHEETTAPNTPQHNGTSERDVGTLTKIARCLVHHSRLPRFLPSSMAVTAMHLSNRISRHTIPVYTPNQRVLGRQPNLHHQGAIGAKAFVHVHGQEDRIIQRAWECQLVAGPYHTESPNTPHLLGIT